MTPKELADFYLHLADYAAKRHDQRRETEWKISLGLWAILLAPFAFEHQIPLRTAVSPFLASGVISLIYAMFWLRPIWLANDKDKQMSKEAWTIAEQFALGKSPQSPPPIRPPRTGFLYSLRFVLDWSLLFQLMVTAVLALMFAIAVVGTP